MAATIWQANQAEWAAQTEERQRERADELSESSRQVSSSLLLANETVHMFCYLSTEIVDAFMIPELRTRVATTLNAILVKLTGPRAKELKVSDPGKYNFNPKLLLQEILRTFLNFSNSEAFVDGIVESGFSDSKMFEQAVRHNCHLWRNWWNLTLRGCVGQSHASPGVCCCVFCS